MPGHIYLVSEQIITLNYVRTIHKVTVLQLFVNCFINDL